MNKKSIYIGIGIIIFGLVGYAAAYRFGEQNKTTVPSDRMLVAASFYPIAHIAKQVGGEYVDVLNLTPVGSEPHDFDPSPKDIVTMQRSAIFIYNGAGLEPWVAKIVSELEQKGVRVVEASKGLALLTGGAHGHEGEEHEDEEHEDEDESADPHVWLDPVLFEQEVQAIASAFIAVDSTHTQEYTKNASAYSQELTALHKEFEQGLSQCKRRDIVTSHAAFAYLAKRYALNMIPIAGMSPNEEPTPARLAEISRIVKNTGITHIFFESLVSPKLAETIATETGAQTISLNPLEGLTDEDIAQGKTYVSVQRENLRALQTALGCL